MSNFFILFILKRKWLRLAIKYIFIILGASYAFGFFLNFFLTGNLSLSFSSWIENFRSNQKIIILMFGVYTILLMAVLIYYYNKYHTLIEENENIILKLSDIAPLWTKHNPIRKVTEQNTEVLEELDIQEDENKTDFIKYIHFNDFLLKEFFQVSIIEKLDLFKNKELLVIVDILKLLEAHGEVSSVASNFIQDKEKDELYELEILQDHVNKKENYALLQKVTMKEHTINVAKQAINLFMEYKKENQDTSRIEDNVTYSNVIISAIAHDIGKLIKQASKSISISSDILLKNNHVDVSIDYFKNIAQNYPNKDAIVKAIGNHHNKNIPNEPLSKILFTADKEARKSESRKLIQEIQAKANTSNSKNDVDKENAQYNIKTYNKERERQKFLDMFVSLLKKNLNSINEIEYMPIASEISYKDIDSISDDKYVYFAFRKLKKIYSTLMQKEITNDEFKEFSKELNELNIIDKYSDEKFLFQITVYNAKAPNSTYMYRITLENIQVTSDSSKKDFQNVFGFTGISLK